MLLLPPLVPLVAAHYGVSVQTVDAIGTAHYLAFGFGAVPAGLLADRLGSRALLLSCLVGSALGTALCALATSFPLFAAGLIVLGAAASLYHPSGLSLISRSTPNERLGRAIGLHGVGGNLGEALAPAAAALLAAFVDFRLAFAVAAASALAFLPATAALPREGAEMAASPHERQGPALSREEATPAAPPRGATKGAHPARSSALFSGKLILILSAALAGGFVYRGATYFLPRHLTDRITPESLSVLEGAARWLSVGRRGDALGAIVTSLALLFGVVAQLWGGRLADRVRRDRMFVTLATLTVPSLLGIAVLHDLPLALAALAFGFLWYMGQPLLNSIAAGLVPKERHGALYGLQFTASFGLGAFSVSLFSWVAARAGTGAAFGALAAVAVGNAFLGVVLSFALGRRGQTR